MERIGSRYSIKSAGLILALLFMFSSSDTLAQNASRSCSKCGPYIRSTNYNFEKRRYKRSNKHARSSYRPYYAPSMENREVKKHTTWEAPTREDLRIKEEIEKTQIDYGPTSEPVGKKMLKYAQRYYDAKDFEKAQKMTEEIIKLDKVSSIDGISIDDVKKLRQEAINKQRQLSIHPDRVGTPANLSVSNAATNKASSPSSSTATAFPKMVGPGVVQIDYNQTGTSNNQSASQVAKQSWKKIEAERRARFEKKRQQVIQQAQNYNIGSPNGPSGSYSSHGLCSSCMPRSSHPSHRSHNRRRSHSPSGYSSFRRTYSNPPRSLVQSRMQQRLRAIQIRGNQNNLNQLNNKFKQYNSD